MNFLSILLLLLAVSKTLATLGLCDDFSDASLGGWTNDGFSVANGALDCDASFLCDISHKTAWDSSDRRAKVDIDATGSTPELIGIYMGLTGTPGDDTEEGLLFYLFYLEQIVVDTHFLDPVADPVTIGRSVEDMRAKFTFEVAIASNGDLTAKVSGFSNGKSDLGPFALGNYANVGKLGSTVGLTFDQASVTSDATFDNFYHSGCKGKDDGGDDGGGGDDTCRQSLLFGSGCK